MKVNIAKIVYKDEQKKRGGDDTLAQAVRASKAAPEKAKKLKKAKGDKSPQAAVVAAKAALNGTQKARNDVQE